MHWPQISTRRPWFAPACPGAPGLHRDTGHRQSRQARHAHRHRCPAVPVV